MNFGTAYLPLIAAFWYLISLLILGGLIKSPWFKACGRYSGAERRSSLNQKGLLTARINTGMVSPWLHGNNGRVHCRSSMMVAL